MQTDCKIICVWTEVNEDIPLLDTTEVEPRVEHAMSCVPEVIKIILRWCTEEIHPEDDHVISHHDTAPKNSCSYLKILKNRDQ